ncbi:cell polarity protein [Moniliophthora roreri MCA 2997]|uniref:Cell polarity protein n=2 Tax=Moniliophthora roreri TaxID=221103 RepID=V2XIX5_MONRO|nr:cell polarity protein [Moniliophthora roreri MCA 2997]KAI3609578.1 cell polarity protein [Moniliophthora roreri]
MKRSQSRAPSPTPTAFSGISSYRNDSYRPIRENNAPPVPQIDYRSISKTHFEELSKYLAAYLARAAPNSRSTARQKLTRLTIQQFHELSTDVYDELIRRKNEKEVPFLPVREDFHPKRNQARQKLATLPTSRFEDLSSDVYFELARRYPEFKEDPSGSPNSTYDDLPAPDFPSNSQRSRITGSRTSGRSSTDRGMDSVYGDPGSGRRPSVDRRRPSEVDYPGRRSEDNNYASGRRSEDNNYPSGRRSEDNYRGRTSEDNYASSASSRRKPSQDTTRRSEDRPRDEYVRRPSAASASVSGNSDSTANAQSTMATSGMIIPNTSTMEEEYIEVPPYGRDARESGSTTTAEDRREISRERGSDIEPDSASDYPSPSPMSPQVGLSGLSGLTSRLRGMDDDDDANGKSGDDLYDRSSLSRASLNSDRSATGIASRLPGARSGVSADQERMRRDYELKIATMQTQISNLQRDLGDAQQSDTKLKDSERRVLQMEEELASVRRRAEEQTSAMRNLQKELDELRETRQLEKDRAAQRARDDEEELQILRDRISQLEGDLESGKGQSDGSDVAQLRANLEDLMSEMTDLQRRNDELDEQNRGHLRTIRDLEMKIKEQKFKYDQVKTELRSVKATSQLFLPVPKLEQDQLPVSVDGGVLDIHVTAFLSAVDALLTAGRSSSPTRVLIPMKSVVNAVAAITDDIRAFERQRSRADVDYDGLRFLRERAEATLSNLVAVSKRHATSSGMAPVSLLDAAASHVAATITDIGKAISIRKATKAEQEQFAASNPSPSSSSPFSPTLGSVGEETHQRSANGRFAGEEYGRRPPSENSSSEQTNSPPPIFDQPTTSAGMTSDDGTEDNWAELKPYLEAQTESIVYAIQSVLSGVRSPTPSPTLNENLTQIITIVSSIVAVCKDNFPASTSQQGNEILRELSEHANKLSEVQALPEVTKESRQIMAKSSFAIANAMKGLMKL